MKTAPQRKMMPSGVDWIGDVPEGWGIVPIKYLTSCNDEVLPENTDSYYEFDYVEIGDVKYESGISSVERIVFGDAPSRARRVVRTEDVIISTVRTYLKAVASIEEFDFPLIVSTGFAVLRAADVYYRYLYYAMLSQDFQSQVTLYSKGVSYPAITSNSLLHIPIRVPPFDEQKRIAAKLDRLCGRVDELAENIKGEIAALQEYRKSLIAECVTKGLNPKAKMKPSGVDWIGDIPEKWAVMRLKYGVTKIGSGKTPLGGATVYSDDGVLFIRSQNVYDNGLVTEDIEYISPEIDDGMTNSRVQNGDVLLNITGGSIGRCCVYALDKRANVNQHVCIIRIAPSEFLNAYVKYFINGFNKIIVNGNQQGGNRESLNFEQIGNLKICVPPFDEQSHIAAFLDKRCAVIDAKIAERQKQLEKLGEYRSSVIYEYVTGKREVSA